MLAEEEMMISKASEPSDLIQNIVNAKTKYDQAVLDLETAKEGLERVEKIKEYLLEVQKELF
jgi:hypothetical protein